MGLISVPSSTTGDDVLYAARAARFLGGGVSFFFDDLHKSQEWNKTTGGAGGAITNDATRVGGVMNILSGDSNASVAALGNATPGYGLALPTGTGGEWYWAARMQAAMTVTGASEYTLAGMATATAPAVANLKSWFGVNAGDSSTKFTFNFEVGGATLSSANADQLFHVFEAYRVGGTTYCLIDGTQIGSGNLYFTTACAAVFVASPKAALVATTLRADWIALAIKATARVTS